ncbi:hypothetical protein C173_26937 [Paenibacillus sp. FSL R7-277]|nr:hypothetical protein C173_26937 [Paenibacillus sp. FSL R7-277]
MGTHGFAPCEEVPQNQPCLLSQNRRFCRLKERTASLRAARPAEPVLFAAQIRRFCRPRDRTASPRAGLAPAPVLFAIAKSGERLPKEALGFAHNADPLPLCKAQNFGLRYGFENPVVGVMERKFGTVGAIAFAFIFGFLPRSAVQIKEIQI